MTIKEVKQSYGSWTVYLRPYTPREILDKINDNPFGHIAIVPGRVNPAEYGDGLLSLARYVGVFRALLNQSDDHYEVKGTGMAFWLGDEDGRGDVYETTTSFSNDTFADTIRGLLPPSGSITEGTLYSVPGGQLYTGSHKYQVPIKAITYVTETFSSLAQPVEWRVNHGGTLDAGPIANLYQMTPKAILVEKEAGRELELVGLQASLSSDYDVENYTTRVVLLGEGSGGAVVSGAADAAPTSFKDIHGNPVKMTKVVSERSTSGGNANARAQVELNKTAYPRRASQINTEEYDAKGDFVVGDYIYVFDPDGGFIDTSQEAFWRGVPINPMKLRVVEMTWPVRANWTVAFRTNSGEWIDLSEYYRPETGSTYIAVGDFLRTLAGPSGSEPVSSRDTSPDSSIPDSPTFTGLSTGSYQSGETNTTKSAIRAQWTTPLNTDGSTVIDGGHYEIRYRTSHYIGYQVKWGQLSGYSHTATDDYNRNVAPGWGSAPTGQPYSVFGIASEYEVNGTARHIHNAASNEHLSILDVSVQDGDVTVTVIPPVVPTGNNYGIAIGLRGVDENNFYLAQVVFRTIGTFSVEIDKRVASTYSLLGVRESVATFTAGSPVCSTAHVSPCPVRRCVLP